MKHCQTEVLINARASTVWDIITDAGNLPVWESGITDIDGELRNGGTIRIRTTNGGRRTQRFRIHNVPGEVMTWTRVLPLGLAKRIRTFTLKAQSGSTHLAVREETRGPLAALLGGIRRGPVQDLHHFVLAVGKRAELLDRRS
jgi:uncharacterized protein YndB with AHSA1/START domain